MKALGMLVVLGAVACGGVDSEAGRSKIQLHYAIDSVFSDAQADAIRTGLAFWGAELTNVELIEDPRRVCTVETAGCFVGVKADADSLWDAELGHYSSGMYHGRTDSISLSKDLALEVTPILVAHEFGHRLGLKHEEVIPSIMNPVMGETTPWELSEGAWERLEALDLL